MSLQFQQQAFELSSLFLSKSCDSLYQHSHLQGLHVDQQPEALHTQDKQAEEGIRRNEKQEMRDPYWNEQTPKQHSYHCRSRPPKGMQCLRQSWQGMV
jgi:hypothetical protein